MPSVNKSSGAQARMKNEAMPPARRRLLAAAIITAVTQPAYALNWELDNGVTVDVDTTLSYDAQWRTASQNQDVLDFGGLGFLLDDGNRAFDKGDQTQNRVSFATDLNVNYGDGGVFARARGWYDKVYDDLDSTKNFQQDGIDIHKSELELLDTFIYHNLTVGDSRINLRAGKQVISWGESLFLGGGISSAQGPVDATKANSPGVELKEIFLPIGQVYAGMELSDTLSLAAYYQYDWEETRIDAPGTYFNVLDGIGQGASGDTLDGLGIPVTEKRPDEGQYGVALRYLAEDLNNTEFGLYYLRYNDFTPALQLGPTSPAALDLEYFKDIDLLGLSFGTVLGDTNVSGEITYRDGQPVQLAQPGTFWFVPAKTVQAQVSTIHTIGKTPLADAITLYGEIGYNRVLSIEDTAETRAMNRDLSSVSANLDNDRGAAGLRVRAKFNYFNIASGLDMAVAGTYRNDFNGVSAVPFTFTEGTEQFALNADFTYVGGHSFGFSQVWFLTDTNDVIGKLGKLELGHANADRDYFAAYYKYRF